jgi:hypothetical protein
VEVLDLLSECLNVWSGTHEGLTPGVGIPQATSASHFFANLFLHDLDNLIKDRGLRYYRYMDDIRIYGYSHDELQRVLVDIDRYLKRHALSLNAKKTGIEELTGENQAESFIGFDYGTEAPDALAPGSNGDDFELMAEQDGAIDVESKEKENSARRRETIKACHTQLRAVSQDIKAKLSSEGRKGLQFHDRAVQRDFMNLGFQFRQAHRILKNLGVPAKPTKGPVLNGWFLLLDQYFWLADQFCWALALYENNPAVKKRLLAFAKKHDCYEWIVHHVYQCLALSQQFSPKELRQLFSNLDETDGWYSRRTVYFLLLHHSHDRQFLQSILSRVAREPDPVLKREILSWVELWGKKGLNREQLMEALGVT